MPAPAHSAASRARNNSCASRHRDRPRRGGRVVSHSPAAGRNVRPRGVQDRVARRLAGIARPVRRLGGARRLPRQGWEPRDSMDFYTRTQGSRLMPYAWFLALEQADNEKLFRDAQNMSRLRYLPQKPTPCNPTACRSGSSKIRTIPPNRPTTLASPAPPVTPRKFITTKPPIALTAGRHGRRGYVSHGTDAGDPGHARRFGQVRPVRDAGAQKGPRAGGVRKNSKPRTKSAARTTRSTTRSTLRVRPPRRVRPDHEQCARG